MSEGKSTTPLTICVGILLASAVLGSIGFGAYGINKWNSDRSAKAEDAYIESVVYWDRAFDRRELPPSLTEQVLYKDTSSMFESMRVASVKRDMYLDDTERGRQELIRSARKECAEGASKERVDALVESIVTFVPASN